MRRNRELVQNAVYHVTARANRQEFIFQNPHIKELFLMIVKKCKSKYSFSVTNFCIMDNHFHIIIKPSCTENLSRIMQWILSQFAKAYNKIHGYTGHVWGTRFFSKIIKGITDFVRTSAYVDENPFEAQICNRSRLYKYSGKYHRKKLCSDILNLYLDPFSQSPT